MASGKNRENSASLVNTLQSTPRFYKWLARNLWWLFTAVIAVIVLFEIFEYLSGISKSTFLTEILIFIPFLAVTELFLIILARGVREQQRMIDIIESKHLMSLNLSGIFDWQELVDEITRIPNEILPVKTSKLFLLNPISGLYPNISSWVDSSEEEAVNSLELPCSICLQATQNGELPLIVCTHQNAINETISNSQRFYLPLKDNRLLIGLLQFTLQHGIRMNERQAYFFSNIGDDLSAAIKVGEDRKNLIDIQSSEIALAERRSVSHYLHDHLGQNLGYLHIKLDQMINEKKRLSLEKVLVDLENMRIAASDSYEIVRGVLETLHPETKQTLDNLLMDHARKISKRANLKLDFKTKGKAVPLPAETQRTIFFAFEETLSNIEKHSKADKISVFSTWGIDEYQLSIRDNGVGFNPDTVDQKNHFGLNFLNERMEKINGTIHINTSGKTGTKVLIQVQGIYEKQLTMGT